jgi:ketosteroid isomerase-like protein
MYVVHATWLGNLHFGVRAWHEKGNVGLAFAIVDISAAGDDGLGMRVRVRVQASFIEG